MISQVKILLNPEIKKNVHDTGFFESLRVYLCLVLLLG